MTARNRWGSCRQRIETALLESEIGQQTVSEQAERDGEMKADSPDEEQQNDELGEGNPGHREETESSGEGSQGGSEDGGEQDGVPKDIC